MRGLRTGGRIPAHPQLSAGVRYPGSRIGRCHRLRWDFRFCDRYRIDRSDLRIALGLPAIGHETLGLVLVVSARRAYGGGTVFRDTVVLGAVLGADLLRHQLATTLAALSIGM